VYPRRVDPSTLDLSESIVLTHCVSYTWFGVHHGRCFRVMTRGIEIRVLDDVNTRSFPGSGCESFCRDQIHWIRRWGLSMGSIPGSCH
jgi:hypothetical protein